MFISASHFGFLSLLFAGTACAAEVCPLYDRDDVRPFLQGLTPFWAQEYVGSDLAIEALRGEPAGEPVPVGFLDDGLDSSKLFGLTSAEVKAMGVVSDPGNPAETRNLDIAHGTMILNAVNARLPIGASDRARAVFFGFAREGVAKLAEPNGAQIFNVSLSFRDGGDYRARANEMAEIAKRALVIFAAGNDYPAGPDSIKLQTDGLLVSSLSPRGYISHFASEDPKVAIAAPGDEFQFGVFGNALAILGFTSGATAEVTGALANVFWLLKGTLNPAQAKALLAATAVGTVNGVTRPAVNGSGLLNSLKLVEVAKILRNRPWKEDWNHEIADGTLFDFRNVVANEMLGAPIDMASLTCPQQKKATKLFRRAVFLSNDATARKNLIALYEQNGFFLNAQFYRSLEWNDFVFDARRDAARAQTPTKQKLALLKTARHLERDGVGLELAKHLLTESKLYDENALAVLSAAADFEGKLPVGIVSSLVDRVFAGEPSVEERKAVARLVRFAGPPGLLRAKQLLRDPDDDVSALALEEVSQMGLPALGILTDCLHDGNAPQRRAAAIAVSRLGPQAAGAVEHALGDRGTVVRANALASIGNWGEAAIPILRLAAGDSEDFVKQRWAEAALTLDRSGVSLEALGPIAEKRIRDYLDIGEGAEFKEMARRYLIKVKRN